MSVDEHRMVEAEYGVVREIERAEPGSATAPRYGVEITVPGVCDSCAIKENCYGAGSVVWAQADEDLQPGDPVRLEMREGTVLKATAWVYGVPLASVFLGTLVGYRWLFASHAEEPRVLLSFGLGVGLMLLAGLVLAKLNDWIGKRLTIRAYRTRAMAPAEPSLRAASSD
ncbi:MAG: SoxR reducing system RseC family protein [Spirochaetota bacterium]